MNKKIDKAILEQLVVFIKRFELSLKKTIYSESYDLDWFEDSLVGFFEAHKAHTLWLINDFFESGDVVKK